MEAMHVNFLAVLVAVVANFFLGFIWYIPLFGKAWAVEMGYDPNEKPDGGAMAKGLILMVIGNFFLAWVFAHNMAAWDFVPGVREASPAAHGILAAVFIWLGFFVPVDMGAMAWEKKSFKLFSINSGYHLASLIVVAMILAHWK